VAFGVAAEVAVDVGEAADVAVVLVAALGLGAWRLPWLWPAFAGALGAAAEVAFGEAAEVAVDVGEAADVAVVLVAALGLGAWRLPWLWPAFAGAFGAAAEVAVGLGLAAAVVVDFAAAVVVAALGAWASAATKAADTTNVRSVENFILKFVKSDWCWMD